MSHFLKGLSADKFNQKYPVGSSFKYFPIMGIPDSVEVVTRTEAWTLGHGAVVVSVSGRAGGVSIEHLKPVVKDKHIEELSKPIAWTDAEELRGMAKDGCGYLFKVDPKNPSIDPRRQIMLHPQEYVDSLLVQLEIATERAGINFDRAEAAEKERDEFRSAFQQNEQVKQGLFAQKELLITANLNISQRAEAAEARLLMPVKLPSEFYFHSSAENIPVMRARHVKEAICAAGFLVEGGSNDH